MTAGRMTAWRRVDESAGHSVARVEQVAEGWLCHGTEVLAGPDELLSCTFRVVVDGCWLTRSVMVTAVSGAGERRLTLRADDERRWWRDGERDPGLDGCLDVDVAATPLTNTFPIRRLSGLAVGSSATSPVAWVDVPTLTVSRVDQTYRRLGPLAWEYSDALHGAFELVVDEDGLVVDYAGFATRVAGGPAA